MKQVENIFKFLIFAVISINCNSSEKWICENIASQKSGDMYIVCGIGASDFEAKARDLARENALREFDSLCNRSRDCKYRNINITPNRNVCSYHSGKHRCLRSFTISLLDKTDDINANDLSKLDKRIKIKRKEYEEMQKIELKRRELELLNRKIDKRNFDETPSIMTSAYNSILNKKPTNLLLYIGRQFSTFKNQNSTPLSYSDRGISLKGSYISIEYRWLDRMSLTTSYAESSIYKSALFGQGYIKAEQSNLNLGARYYLYKKTPHGLYLASGIGLFNYSNFEHADNRTTHNETESSIAPYIGAGWRAGSKTFSYGIGAIVNLSNSSDFSSSLAQAFIGIAI